MPKMADDGHDFDRALNAARDRGRLRAAELLSDETMLDAAAFADLLGVSGDTVEAKRERHEVLALDDASGSFRFPAWQVDQEGKPFAILPKLFELLGDSPWAVYRFLVQHHAALGGASARDTLTRGRADWVVKAAEGLAHGTFA